MKHYIPHEPSVFCIDNCNNPLECKRDYDIWQKNHLAHYCYEWDFMLISPEDP